MFRHVGIVVYDLDKMSKFYQETFGLELMYNEVEEGEFLENIVDKVGSRAHIHKLGKDGNTIVELLKWDEIYESEGTGGNKMFTPGITHFALTVDDLEKVLSVVHLTIGGPKTSINGKVKVAFCYDPEGNILELVECI